MDFPELGGDEEDRTLDLTDANRTLSQLSYIPTYDLYKNQLYMRGVKVSIGQNFLL